MKNTPYIIVTLWFPAHKTLEVVKTFFERMKKYPHDEELSEWVVPNAVSNGKYGMKTISIYKVKEGKLEEHLAFTSKVLAMFHSIEGLAYSVRVWSTVQEALASIGQQ